MTGVEILSSAEVASEFGIHWWLFAIFTLIVSLGTTILIFCIAFDADINFVPISISIIVGLLAGCIVGFAVSHDKLPTAYETQYKVTIDDSVSMNEFLDKYEIIDQEGKTYTVKEREQ